MMVIHRWGELYEFMTARDTIPIYSSYDLMHQLATHYAEMIRAGRQGDDEAFADALKGATSIERNPYLYRDSVKEEVIRACWRLARSMPEIIWRAGS